MSRIIEHLTEIQSNYDALFVDLWGCIHNGVQAFPEAVAALQSYRQTGGKVVLLTNAPRPRSDVATQIENFGVPDDAWDTIVTSGDSARAAMFRGAVGEKVWFMGNDRLDANFFEPLKIIDKPADIQRVPLQEAEGIVCTGPFNVFADPTTLRPELLIAREKGLKLLCANPDIVVDRGEERQWCAGAVAKLYTEMGGESLYFGKPHPPIYDLARRRLFALGTEIHDSRILCIGDGILTDVAGAMGEDLDCLFITGGLAAKETGTTRQPDPAKLEAYLREVQSHPAYSIGFLR